MSIKVRPATSDDIPAMHNIRISVRENQLSDPTRITEQDYLPYVGLGSAWVAVDDAQILGFAAVDAGTASVWALFVDPRSERLGAGRALHQRMLEWAIQHGIKKLSLTTGAGTRAERFYRRESWIDAGTADAGEVRLERLL